MEIDRAGRFLEYSCSAQFLRRKKNYAFFQNEKSLENSSNYENLFMWWSETHLCQAFRYDWSSLLSLPSDQT